MPALIPILLILQYSEEYANGYILQMYPNIYNVYSRLTCSAYYDDILPSFAMYGALVLILIVAVGVTVFSFFSFKLLISVRKSLTKATYLLHKRLCIVLWFQAIIPLICLLVPSCMLFGAMLMGSDNMFRRSF